MKTLSITTPAIVTTSTIHIQDGALKRSTELLNISEYSKLFVVSDEGAARHLPALMQQLPANTKSLLLPAGEHNKTIDAVQKIWTALQQAGCDRHSLVINVGGGIVCDLGGFAASTYMRGIAYANIPTTLLAQVDASVGGKNGCNHAGVKNLIGTFTQPKHVIIDPSVLITLPKRELIAGFGEIIKHGLIASEAHVGQATAKLPNEFSTTDLADIIADSCSIKQVIVAGDITERGERKKVNFGHTVGHAIESLSLGTSKPLLHGEAVSIGMMAETYIANANGLITNETVDTVKTLLETTGLPTTYTGLLVDEIVAKMKSDKKNTAGAINFTLLTKIGDCVVDQTASMPFIVAAFQKIGATI